jgi:FkbM family methyltransferase
MRLNKRISCIDIGGRGGPDGSLLPIAHLVDYSVVEPDPEESRRLRANTNHKWRSVNVITTAIGTKAARGNTEATERVLNLYRQRGCSSFYDADTELASRYDRSHYYILDDRVPVPVQGLDEALFTPDTDYSYMKIDIQGAELEAFESGPAILDQLVLLRTEVSFMPIYKGQPLFSEVYDFLTHAGFELLRFVEMHHWRRNSRTKYPDADKSGIASVGQLVHGDALFVRAPETLGHRDHAGSKLLDLALLTAAYGETDLSAVALRQTPVVDRLRTVDPDASVENLTKRLIDDARKRSRRTELRRGTREFLKRLAGRKV